MKIILGIVVILLFILLTVIVTVEMIVYLKSYNGWKKIKHDTGNFYLMLDKINDGQYDIEISKIPMYIFKIDSSTRGMSKRSIRLSEFENDENILALLKNYVNSTINEYNLSKNKKNIIREWDGNILSKKAQRKENLNKIIS